jgi:hypothetical protein
MNIGILHFVQDDDLETRLGCQKEHKNDGDD